MSRGVFLRRAGPGDVAALVALETAASLHPWNEAQLASEVVRPAPDAVLVLAGREGLSAWLSFRLVVEEVQVMNLAVRPEERRHGLGRFLLRTALAIALRAGAKRALLEVRASNAAARTLYGLFGFGPLGVRKQYYRDPSEDALVLVRELGSTLN